MHTYCVCVSVYLILPTSKSQQPVGEREKPDESGVKASYTDVRRMQMFFVNND